MAKIPIATRPNVTRHDTLATKLNAAPDINMGVEDYASLSNSLIKGFNQVSQAYMQTQSSLKHAEDMLQGDELNLIEVRLDGDITDYVQNNPQDYENFGEHLKELEQKASDSRKECYNKMTPDMQKRARSNSELVAMKRQQQLQGTYIQARASAMLGDLDNKIGEYCRLGRSDEAINLLNRATESDGEHAPLLSTQQRDARIAEVNNQAEFYSVSDMIGDNQGYEVDGTFIPVKEALQAKNSDGSYKYFTHLARENRQNLSNSARGKQAEYATEQSDLVAYKINRGELVTIDEYQAQLDNGQITTGQFNRIDSILKQNEQAKEQAKVQQQQAITKQEQAKQAEATKQAEYSATRLEYDLITKEFSQDPNVRKEEYCELAGDIQESFLVEYPALAIKLRRQLDSCSKFAEKPDSSYKNGFNYKYGMEAIDSKKKSFSPAGTNWFNKSRHKDETSANYQMAKVAMDEFIQNNPNASRDEIDVYIADLIVKVNETNIEDCMTFWRGMNQFDVQSEVVEAQTNSVGKD